MSRRAEAAAEAQRPVHAAAPIVWVEAAAYRVPTDAPESDGTIAWDATTLVVAEVGAGGLRGLGYTYADAAAAGLITRVLAERVKGLDAMAVPEAWAAMVASVRNLGRPGIASCAIAALDVALWDLKARLLGVSLAALLGPARTEVPVYGSGGFTSYDEARLCAQLAGWVEEGIEMVKMKVGREPDADVGRVRAVRAAIGSGPRLFIDANGAYLRKRALAIAAAVAPLDVSWFEEPVSSDDLAGLRMLRDRVPAGMAVAAGEYGYDIPYFRRMLEAEAVDVLQVDATRCAGITGFLKAAAVAEAHHLTISAHTAPSLHLAPALALPGLDHLEWFHDHVRIERMLFDGAPMPERGHLRADLGRPGHGLALKRADAERFVIA